MNLGNGSSISPFLKWAGGKRWLAQEYMGILPSKFKRYFEPFLGSGALYFRLAPPSAILSDTNAELIDTYNAIKDHWGLVNRYLREHHRRHSSDYYYRIRSMESKALATRAARMLYLNRTCWNGLYRVNKTGKFNVPIGTKTNVLFDIDSFERRSELLQGADIRCTDFEESIGRAREGDFVFADPPYTVKHNHNGFIKYNENLFTWRDQVRLKECIDRAVARGVQVVVSNAAHESIEGLYSNYSKIRISRKSIISSQAMYRGEYEELLIQCW